MNEKTLMILEAAISGLSVVDEPATPGIERILQGLIDVLDGTSTVAKAVHPAPQGKASVTTTQPATPAADSSLEIPGGTVAATPGTTIPTVPPLPKPNEPAKTASTAKGFNLRRYLATRPPEKSDNRSWYERMKDMGGGK